MKFYDCATAPSPRRVRIFMAEKGLEITSVQVDLAAGEQFGEAFRAINPDCTVPVLELDDGRNLSDVFAICLYLELQHPEPPLMGCDAAEKAIVTMWNNKLEWHLLAPLADAFRNRAKGLAKRALPGPDSYEQIPLLAERGRTRALSYLAKLNAQLESREFVAGDAFSVADITLAVAVDFAAWSRTPVGDELGNLRRWHVAVSSRPSMRA
jgi:glutathione S-transferase